MFFSEKAKPRLKRGSNFIYATEIVITFKDSLNRSRGEKVGEKLIHRQAEKALLYYRVDFTFPSIETHFF